MTAPSLRRYRIGRMATGRTTIYGRTVTALCRECRHPLFEVVVDGTLAPQAAPMALTCAAGGAGHIAHLDRALAVLREHLDTTDRDWWDKPPRERGRGRWPAA